MVRVVVEDMFSFGDEVKIKVCLGMDEDGLVFVMGGYMVGLLDKSGAAVGDNCERV